MNKAVYGSDAAAMKAAGHELLNAKTVMQKNFSRLSFPMMCVIDYFGHRIVSMSLLPIRHDTLVYGSADACKTVICKDSAFVELITNVAKALKLKHHVVNASGVTLCTPGDLEGHLGLDGNFYLIDAARLMPPEAPGKSAIFIPADEALPARDIKTDDSVMNNSDKWNRKLERLLGEDTQSEMVVCTETPIGTIWYLKDADEVNVRASCLIGRRMLGNVVLMRRNRASTLYRLLRPEFVETNPVPLCSDAFTHFQDADPDKEQHNQEIVEATKRLFQEVIPDFADALNRHHETPVTFEELSQMMHKRGINIRHMGRVRKLVTVPHLRSFLLTDLVARVCKNDLRHRLRMMLKTNAASKPDVVRKEVVAYFNLILGSSKRTLRHWNLDIKVRIQHKFIDALSDEEIKDYHKIRDDLLVCVVPSLCSLSFIHLNNIHLLFIHLVFLRLNV